MKNIVQKAIPVAIGLLFLVSGALKAFDSADFAMTLARYGIARLAYLSPVLSGIEVALGMCLILRIKLRQTALIAGILTAVFTVAFAYGYFFRGIEDCGCMGPLVKIPPYISFARNVLMLLGAFWLWNFEDNKPVAESWRLWPIYVFTGASLVLGGYTLNKSIVDKNHINVGDQVATTFLNAYSDSLSTGRHIVFVFSPNCSHCWNATENVKSINEVFGDVMGITFPFSDTRIYEETMHPNFPIYTYSSNRIYNYVREVPVLLVIENGTVRKVFKATEIPCGPVLKRIIGG